nr:SH3 beta-barrel fold-containing protein [Bacteroides intestinalis]
MATNFKNQMRELMKQAWMLVKVYGFSMAEAMKQAWQVLKLKAALKNGVVKFYYQKLNGEVRTAWDTLKEGLIPETKGTERKKNESLITYFDNEKQAYRSFKVANLIKVG